MQRIALAVVAGGLLGLCPDARADEVIQLVDNTKIVGTLVHYFDGVLTVKLPNGTDLKLPSDKVRQLKFKLPKPRAALSTPKKTYQRMRKAAIRGDLATYLDCHSAYYQMFLHHQIELTKPDKFAKRLKKEWGDVQLEVVGTKKKGKTAVMKVRRKKGGDSQDGELRFVKENSEWKMILPL